MIYAYDLCLRFVRTCAYDFGKIDNLGAQKALRCWGEEKAIKKESDKESGGVKWIGRVGCDRMVCGEWEGVEAAWWKIFYRIFC